MKMAKNTIDDIDVRGKRVLMRVDFNVPMQDGLITDDNRIAGSLPSIRRLVEKGAKVILCSHLGKPKQPQPQLSLAPCAVRLAQLLQQKVVFAASDEVTGENVHGAIAAMAPGDVLLLENTRFRKEETKNEENFSRQLAALCDVYVNDAFGSAHRAHCSTTGVAAFVPVSAVGYLMAKEIEYLGNAINNPKRPLLAILGGAKIADKLLVIETLLNKVNAIIIGGGMAYTFLKAQGYQVGQSLVDDEKLEYCRKMLDTAQKKGVALLLPVDVMCLSAFPQPINAAISPVATDIGDIAENVMGLDIGPKTQLLFTAQIQSAATVIWNGPMGVFENPALAKGTLAVAQAMAGSGALSIIGGGDSAAAVIQMGLASSITHISTGGGASLEYLEGKLLPGLGCIQDKA